MSQGAIHSAFSNMFCPHVTCRCNCTENPQLLLQNSHDMLHWGTDENHFQFLSYAMQIFACHTGFSFGFRFGFFVCLCPYYNQSHTKKQKQTNFDWLQWCWSIYLILSYLMALTQYLSGAYLVNMNAGVNACIALRI